MKVLKGNITVIFLFFIFISNMGISQQKPIKQDSLKKTMIKEAQIPNYSILEHVCSGFGAFKEPEFKNINDDYNDCYSTVSDEIAFPTFFGSNSVIHSGDILVNTMTEVGSEISVSVDPNNGEYLREANMYGGINSNDPTHVISWNKSDVCGLTWSGSELPIYGATSDPTSVVTRNGNWYISFIRYLETIGTAQRCAVSIALDEGNGNWSMEDVNIPPALSTNDKPHLAVDNTTLNGNYYCAWTLLNILGTPPNNCNQILMSKNGESPITLSNSGISNLLNQGANIQIGSDGEVYVSWAIKNFDNSSTDYLNEIGIGFIRSLDHGSSYNDGYGHDYGRNVISINGIRRYPNDPPLLLNRLNSFPSMCIDKSGGPHNGRIYLVWANHGLLNSNPADAGINIYMIFSDDKGVTWSNESPINIPPIKINPTYQWISTYQALFPWISCDDETGALSIIFIDNHEGPDLYYRTFVSMSNDFGNTWETSPVSDNKFLLPNGNWSYYDYININSVNGIVYPVFASTSAMSYACGPKVFISPYYAWNCIEDYPEISNAVISGHIKEWQAENTITARNEIQEDGVAVFKAGEEIKFIPHPDDPDENGFFARSGSYVSAFIKSCNPDFPSSNNELKQLYVKDDNSRTPSLLTPSVKIYPNPTKGVFEVIFPDSMKDAIKIEIIDPSGSAIRSYNFTKRSQFEFDLSELPRGFYLIKISSSQCNIFRKLLLQ